MPSCASLSPMPERKTRSCDPRWRSEVKKNLSAPGPDPAQLGHFLSGTEARIAQVAIFLSRAGRRRTQLEFFLSEDGRRYAQLELFLSGRVLFRTTPGFPFRRKLASCTSQLILPAPWPNPHNSALPFPDLPTPRHRPGISTRMSRRDGSMASREPVGPYSSLGRQKSQVSTNPTAKAMTTPAAATTM